MYGEMAQIPFHLSNKKGGIGVKTHLKEPKRASNVR
jgi:hypothetical protein